MTNIAKNCMTPRNRKSKNPCGGCFLNASLCICSQIPLITLNTKVTLVIHKNELAKTSNTGMLAIKALTNSTHIVRGASITAIDLSNLIQPEYINFLLYPSDTALELTPQLILNYKNEFHKPIHLIVPDGSWRQASKVHYRHKELQNLVRLKITTPNLDQLYFRREATIFGMGTLPAIAHALGVIENDEIKSQLITVYWSKLTRSFKSRGKLL